MTSLQQLTNFRDDLRNPLWDTEKNRGQLFYSDRYQNQNDSYQDVTLDTLPIAMDFMVEMVTGIHTLILHITMTCHFATEMIMHHHQTAGRRILDVFIATG